MATPRYIQNPSTAASDQLRSELGSYLGQIMNRKKAMDNFALQLRAQDNDFERSLVERDIDRKDKLDSERRADERYFDRLKEQREYSENEAQRRRGEAKEDLKEQREYSEKEAQRRRGEAKEDAAEARGLRKIDEKAAEARVNKLNLERSYNAMVSAAVLAGVDEKHIVADPEKIENLKKATVDLSRHIKEATDLNEDTEEQERRRDNLLIEYQKLGVQAPEQGEDEGLGAYVNSLATGYAGAVDIREQQKFDDQITRRYKAEVPDQEEGLTTAEKVQALAKQKVLTEIELASTKNLAQRHADVKSQYAKLRKIGVIEEVPEDQLNNIVNLDDLEIGVYGATTRMEVDRFDSAIKEKAGELIQQNIQMERMMAGDNSLRQYSIAGIVSNPKVAMQIAMLAPENLRDGIIADLRSGDEAKIAGIVQAMSGTGTTVFTSKGLDERVGKIIETARTERLKNLSNDAVDRDGNVNPAGLATALQDFTQGPKISALYGNIEKLTREIGFIDRDKRDYLGQTSLFDSKNKNSFYYTGGRSLPQPAQTAQSALPSAGSSVPQAGQTALPSASGAAATPGTAGGSLPAPTEEGWADPNAPADRGTEGMPVRPEGAASEPSPAENDFSQLTNIPLREFVGSSPGQIEAYKEWAESGGEVNKGMFGPSGLDRTDDNAGPYIYPRDDPRFASGPGNVQGTGLTGIVNLFRPSSPGNLANIIASKNSDGTFTDAGFHSGRTENEQSDRMGQALAGAKSVLSRRFGDDVSESDRVLMGARGEDAVKIAKRLGLPMGNLRADVARHDQANAGFNKRYIEGLPATWEEKYMAEGLPFSNDWTDLRHFGSHSSSPIQALSRVSLANMADPEAFRADGIPHLLMPEAPSVPKPTALGPGRSASGVAPSVRDAGYTRSLPAPAPYNVVGERAQYEEDNFLPYAYSPPPPVGPAPVPMRPSDFTMIDGQIVPKQPAPSQPHPYANVPSVPPPVDQPYYEPLYEPLDTTSQGYNLPQYIRAQEKYPHPSEADIDYRIRRMYGPHPSGPSIPIPQP